MIHTVATTESIDSGLQVSLGTWVGSLGEPSRTGSPGQTVTIVESAGKHLRLTAPSLRGSPGVGSEGQCGILFDGWLYNRAALRADFRSTLPDDASDAALALEAYRRWGDEALRKLKGIFALCIWDGRTRTLLCARDPLGVYPLFYVRLGASWLFSTSIDALLRHPGVPVTINRVALAAYLLRQYRDIEETYFSSIRRIPPGHLFRVEGASDTPHIVRYWNPLPAGRIDWVHEEELEQFSELMKQAIGRCLQLGRAGIYLSGGLDSGSIATCAADYTSEKALSPLQAISLVHADAEVNEERIQRGIADNLGIPQTLISFEGSSGGGRFHEALRANCTWPHPSAVGLSPLHLTLGHHARAAGCDVVLSGEGGDEWLAVHYRLAADFLRRGEVFNLAHLWKTAKETARGSRYGAARRVLGEHGVRPLFQEGVRASLRLTASQILRARRRRLFGQTIPPWLSPDPELREALYQRVEKAADQASGTFYQREIVQDILDQPLTVLYKEDAFESSRRTRVLMLEPFYDPDVISFLVRIPPWLRSRGGRYKGLLRQSLHQRHPELGYDRQKKPYATNLIAGRVLGGAAWAWPALKGTRTLAELGVVDAAQMDKFITEVLRTADVTETRRVWMSLCAEVWARTRLDASSTVWAQIQDGRR